jgi:hypothetical protein
VGNKSTYNSGLRKIHLLHDGRRDFRNGFETGLVPLGGLACAGVRHEVRIEVHWGPVDAQSPEVRTLVGPREVAVQVVEVEVHWDGSQIYERGNERGTRTFGVAGRSLLDPHVEVLEDWFGEAVGVNHVVEF